MTPTKNIFLIEDDNMKPFISKGDIATFESMRIGYKMASSIYIIEYKGTKMITRVQLLIKGGISLLFDGAKHNNIKIEQSELKEVVFIGHVTGIIKATGEEVKRFSLYEAV